MSGDAKLLVTTVWRYSGARPVRYQSLGAAGGSPGSPGA